MTSQLSDRDFQRLQVYSDILYFVPGLNWTFQESLLELKTQNYTLEDQARKQRHALGEVSTAILTCTLSLLPHPGHGPRQCAAAGARQGPENHREVEEDQ